MATVTEERERGTGARILWEKEWEEVNGDHG